MASFIDVRTLSSETRQAAADKIRTLRDFDLPDLQWFNNGPCDRHVSLAEGMRQLPSPCRRCGVEFRRHQRVGIAWLYMRGSGLIADQVGLGKTAQAAGLLALIKQNGELKGDARVIVVCRPAAIDQWCQELARFLPAMNIIDNTGARPVREKKYKTGYWDILVTGYQMLVRDHENLSDLLLGAVVIDDVDPLRNRNTQASVIIKRTARQARRVIILNATPLQKQLVELHSMTELVGGFQVFGSQTSFRRQYERQELVRVYNKSIGREVVTRKTTGYKNIPEFIAKLAPMTLRRTAAHVDDVDLPEIMPPNNIQLELYPAQRARYEELREGVLRIVSEKRDRVNRTVAMNKFLYGAMICDGLVALDERDGPSTSSKLDWVQNIVADGDLSEEKVVVFAQFTSIVAALSARLSSAGVGHVKIWGRDSSKDARAEAQRRFRDDPGCRVLIGTAAIEASLNLQTARHLINVDQLMNPARMQQLVGRIRRDGSVHRAVYVHNLFTRGTQEERYLDSLRTEQALSDIVWGESNELYEALPPLQLLHLIGGQSKGNSCQSK